MVNNFFLSFIIIFLLVGCSHPTTDLNEGTTKPEMNNMTNDKKDAFDKQYLNDLIDIEISEKDFVYISKYIIELAKKSNFPEVDSILGKKEYMSTKDFSYPYSFYHYANIPFSPQLEVILKYEKDNNKLKSVSLTPGGAGNFFLRDSHVNVLNELKLKLVKKEQLDYSNKLAMYYLTDGILNYEVVGNNDDFEGNLTKKIYNFDIYIE
jgi:hypothetical protein